VPLSKRAIELLGFLPKCSDSDNSLFGLTTASLDAKYRKTRVAACTQEVNFHDTRHEAITRLSKKLNVLELARMERFFYFLKWRLTDSAAFAADEFPLTDTNKASHNYTHCCNIELLLK
jgi:hypothetical protein